MLPFYFLLNVQMSTYPLITDSDQIGSINTNRVMVAAALVYLYTIHYMLMGVAFLLRRKVKSERMYDHGRRLVLYGIAALLGCNFLNYGLYHAVMAWVLLIWMLVMHTMAFIVQISEDLQNAVLAGYYLLLAAWFIVIALMHLLSAFG